MLEFPARAETAERPGLNTSLVSLLGATHLDPAFIHDWIPEWRLAFESAMENSRVDSRIHPARLNYYEKAVRSLLAGENPRVALWPLLQTWTLAVEVLPEEASHGWRVACEQLRLTATGLEEQVSGLDQYLDEVEILLDELATQHGLETSTSI